MCVCLCVSLHLCVSVSVSLWLSVSLFLSEIVLTLYPKLASLELTMQAGLKFVVILLD